MLGKSVTSRAIIFYLTAIILFATLSNPLDVLAITSNADCLMCHSSKSLKKESSKKPISLYIDPKRFKASAHGEQSCVECHVDLINQPLAHKANTAPVDCARCHPNEASHPDAIHSGVRKEKRPLCKDCHGSHYIPTKNDPNSDIIPANSEALCRKCHANSDALKKYREGIHGMAKDESGRAFAGCTDCHNVHKGLSAVTPQVCADCHLEEVLAFSASIHSTALNQGSIDAPTCIKCHGEHDILPSADPRSPTHAMRITKLCGQCHDNPKITRKYGLLDDRIETYLESYHGIAVRHGNLKAATCVSCHQAHSILSSSDPASTTYKRNLPDTCGKCHPKTNERWAEGKSHVTISPADKNVLYYVSRGFKWLTIGTMTALIGHIMLDLYAHVRRRLRNGKFGGRR
jgi:nitrate/TMAO reductase-like tetraheme cytochrome c subunit